MRILQKQNIDEYTFSNYADAKVRANKIITFKHIMTHTSGLTKITNIFIWSIMRCPNHPFLYYSEKRTTRNLRNTSLTRYNSFCYSNLGMGLLGYLISNIDKRPLDILMVEELFQQLSITSTSLGLSENQYSNVIGNIGSNKEPEGT